MSKPTDQENWDDLEVFTSKGARLKYARITILETSIILLNAGFYHKAKVADKSHIILSFSPQNRAMVFQFTSDAKAAGALAIIKRSGGAQLGSRSFFTYYLLNPKDLAGRYEPVKKKLPKIGDAWVIRLDSKLLENEEQPQ